MTEALQELETTLRGELIDRDDPRYDDDRRIYNGMIDKRPRAIAHCRNVRDVLEAVDFCREAGWTLAVRSGGHNGPGLALCDDGLVVDLSAMRGIRVDPENRTVRVEAGCTWGDVDHATHAFGLATVSGIISTTGVAGLTLGGGHGYLTRKYGLTIDNLLEADVVLADGRFVTASADRNADLFWALRGGGGNFGIVTSFVFRLHPVSHVHAGPTFYPIEAAGDVLRWYRRIMLEGPDDLYGFFAFLEVPPAPMFPQELHGRTMCSVVWCYAGPDDGAGEALAPVRKFGPPAFEHVVRMPYPALQGAFDAIYPPGLRWYWKGDFVRDLDNDAIRKHVEHGSKLPTPLSTMHLYPINGAAHHVGSSDTAFAYRDANWSMVIAGVAANAGDDRKIETWAREYQRDLHPHSAGGAYVNFMMEEGQDRVRATYRDNYDRLVEIKSKVDPDNLFCVNQNIAPRGR